MPKTTILKVTVYDDATYELSRGPDCDDRPVKGTMKKKKNKKKKKGSG